MKTCLVSKNYIVSLFIRITWQHLWENPAICLKVAWGFFLVTPSIILLFDLWTPEILELELFINSNAITARMYNTKNGKECWYIQVPVNLQGYEVISVQRLDSLFRLPDVCLWLTLRLRIKGHVNDIKDFYIIVFSLVNYFFKNADFVAIQWSPNNSNPR